MCTVIILRRPGHPWPLLIAANRDEMAGRPWRAPGRHWQDRANVTAGLDELAGGTWQGVNDEGVTAAILNRMGTLGPLPGKRSRGELVLEALDHADACDAADALRHLSPGAYRPFNMVIADNRDAFFLKNDGSRILVQPLPEGLSMLTAQEPNDESDPRIRDFLPRFRAAAVPDPESGDWREWENLLAARPLSETAGEDAALCISRADGFGTVSSALIALPAMDRPGVKPKWRFAPGKPGLVPFEDITL